MTYEKLGGNKMNNLGRKVLSVMLAGTLSIAMGITAFAAPSPEKNAVVTEVTESVDKNGNHVEVIIEDLKADGKEAAKLLQDKQTLKKVIGDNYVDGMEVIDVREVRAIGSPTFPLTVTFKVPGVLASTKVAVLHYENGAWTEEPSKAGKGTITATFDSLSPVAFVVDKNASASSTVSPKTGETPTVAVVGVIAVVALAGAVVFRKRTAFK